MLSKIIPFLNSLTQPLRVGDLDPLPGRKSLLIAGILIYSVTQILFNAYIMHDRQLAYDPSDAYTYIIKATQIEQGCFLQDCPAIETLQSELKDATNNAGLDWTRYRAYARVSLVYHPLHSLILTGLHAVGLSWETAYQILLISGAIIIGLGAGLLAQSMFGSVAAAITLIILSFSQFQGQGLHLIVPSNISLGLMMLSWAFIISRREKAYWLIFTLIIATVTMHAAGKIYALMTLGVFFLLDRRVLTAKIIGGYLVMLLPIASMFVLPHVVSKPVLSLPPEPMGDMTYWEGFKNNILQAFFIVRSWDGRVLFDKVWIGYFSAAFAALSLCSLALVSLFCLAPQRRKMFLLVAGGMAALCFVSMFFVLPHYPAELFSRVWCAAAVLIAGAASYTILNFEKVMLQNLRAIRPFAVGVFFVMLVMLIIGGSRSIYKTASLMKDIENVEFSNAQVDYIKSNCGTMLYTAETNLLYYLSQNALHCPSVYMPGLKDRADGEEIIGKLPSPYLLVVDQPLPTTIHIKKKSETAISFDNYTGPKQVSLKFGSDIPAIHLTVHINEKPFDLTAHPGEWLSLPESIQKGDKVTISGDFDPPVYLHGIMVGKQKDAQDWPWGQGIVLTYKTRVIEGYNFSFQSHTKSIFNKFDIIDSAGSSLLVKAQLE